jgi:hypothetical protein
LEYVSLPTQHLGIEVELNALCLQSCGPYIPVHARQSVVIRTVHQYGSRYHFRINDSYARQSYLCAS